MQLVRIYACMQYIARVMLRTRAPITPHPHHIHLLSPKAKSCLGIEPAPASTPAHHALAGPRHHESHTAESTLYLDKLEPDVLALSRTAECFQLIERDPCLTYSLPRKGSLPGRVLKHCFQTLECHLQRKSPMAFKIGYTHCAYTRWWNSVFGYTHEKMPKWEGMVVVFASSNTVAASYVEAAMIQHFKGGLSAVSMVCSSNNVTNKQNTCNTNPCI